MGWIGDSVDRVRKFFAADKEQKLQRGTAEPPVTPWGTSGIFGFGINAGSSTSPYDPTMDLLVRYRDYAEMNEYPELSSALDIYAEESTKTDSLRGRVIWPVTESNVIESLIDDLFVDRLDVDNDMWLLSRTLCWFGNAYAEVLLDDDGVVGLTFLAPETMQRIEDERGKLYGFVQDYRGGRQYSPEDFVKILADQKRRREGGENMGGSPTGRTYEPQAFEPWEIIHWRLQTRANTPYGYSVLEPARFVFRRLVMLEDASVLHKLVKSAGRYAYYVETGNVPQKQGMAYVDEVRRRMKRKRFIDNQGRLDLRSNPLGSDEDLYIPSRKGEPNVRVELLSGAEWQSMEDVEYFRDKMFSAIKVSKSYLGFGGESNRASLAQEDARFASSGLRVQRAIEEGYKRLAKIHMLAKNVDPKSKKWSLTMTPPSDIRELAQIETLNARAGVAQALSEFFPREWILTNIFNLSDRETAQLVARLKKQRIEDAKIQAEADKITMAAQQPPGGGPDGPGDQAEESADNDVANNLEWIRQVVTKIRLEQRRSKSRPEHLSEVSAAISNLTEKVDSLSSVSGRAARAAEVERNRLRIGQSRRETRPLATDGFDDAEEVADE